MQHSGNPFVPLLGKFHLKAQTFILLFLSCVFGILATKPQSILFSLYVKVLVYSNNQDMEFENSGVIAGGFPCGSASKESACSAGDMSLIPGLGRSPGEGKGYPLQYCGLENSKDCIVCKESDPTEWLSLSLSRLNLLPDFFHPSGRGPLQSYWACTDKDHMCSPNGDFVVHDERKKKWGSSFEWSEQIFGNSLVSEEKKKKWKQLYLNL